MGFHSLRPPPRTTENLDIPTRNPFHRILRPWAQTFPSERTTKRIPKVLNKLASTTDFNRVSAESMRLATIIRLRWIAVAGQLVLETVGGS